MPNIEGIPATPKSRKAAAQARRDWAQTEAETQMAHDLSEATAKAIVARARARYGEDSPDTAAVKRVLTNTLHCATNSPSAEPLPEVTDALDEANHVQWRASARVAQYFLQQLGRVPPFTLLRGGKDDDHHEPKNPKGPKGTNGGGGPEPLELDNIDA